MANGTVGASVRTDTEKFAALDERVTNLRSSFQNLEHQTTAGFGRIDSKLGEMSAAFSAAQRTPWGTIATFAGVLFSVLVGIGWLVYQPVQVEQVKLEASLVKVNDTLTEAIKEGPETYVPRREIETARQRAAEDRINTLASITDLRTAALPRNEWMLRNATVDREFEDVRRTLEQLRSDFGGTYSLRDAIADLKSRIERFEARETGPLK